MDKRFSYMSASKNILKVAIVSFFVYVVLFFIALLNWLVITFPLNNAEGVLFTLLTSKTGTKHFVVDLLIDSGVLRDALNGLFVVLLLALLVSVLLRKKMKCFWKPYVLSMFVCGIFLGSFFLVNLFTKIPVTEYAKTLYTAFSGPKDSPFYRDNYIFPDSVQIIFPEKKYNLIYIMLESMETNFAPITPELDSLSKVHLSFLPGGYPAANTDLTIASQTAKLCGLPLSPPLHEAMFGTVNGIKNFMGNATCFTDILAKEGYSQTYIQGSDSEFGSKKYLWTLHGNVNVHDLLYFEENGLFKKENEHFWGFDDAELYHLAKHDLNEIVKDTTKPFAFYLLTVDTHIPYGYLNSECPEKVDVIENQLPAVISCTSFEVSKFIEWIQAQPWFENTVIVVVGDHVHPYFNASEDMNRFVAAKNLLGEIDQQKKHFWVNFFINSQKEPAQVNRKFNSFDMFPTILESIGADIEGHALGFGRSLFSDEKTLLERYPKEMIDSVLKTPSSQYNYFMYGNVW